VEHARRAAAGGENRYGLVIGWRFCCRGREPLSQPAEGTLDTRKRKGRVPCQWCRATPAAP
jgi:hypothetical protein